MAVKQEKFGRPAVGFGEADDSPDVVEVAPPPGMGLDQEVYVVDVDADDNGNGWDMDVVAVGGDNMLVAGDMPHPRETCTKFLFSKHPTASNERFCPNCFCFVCETKASECQVSSSLHVPYCFHSYCSSPYFCVVLRFVQRVQPSLYKTIV